MIKFEMVMLLKLKYMIKFKKTSYNMFIHTMTLFITIVKSILQKNNINKSIEKNSDEYNEYTPYTINKCNNYIKSTNINIYVDILWLPRTINESKNRQNNIIYTLFNKIPLYLYNTRSNCHLNYIFFDKQSYYLDTCPYRHLNQSIISLLQKIKSKVYSECDEYPIYNEFKHNILVIFMLYQKKCEFDLNFKETCYYNTVNNYINNNEFECFFYDMYQAIKNMSLYSTSKLNTIINSIKESSYLQSIFETYIYNVEYVINAMYHQTNIYLNDTNDIFNKYKIDDIISLYYDIINKVILATKRKLNIKKNNNIHEEFNIHQTTTVSVLLNFDTLEKQLTAKYGGSIYIEKSMADNKKQIDSRCRKNIIKDVSTNNQDKKDNTINQGIQNKLTLNQHSRKIDTEQNYQSSNNEHNAHTESKEKSQIYDKNDERETEKTITLNDTTKKYDAIHPLEYGNKTYMVEKSENVPNQDLNTKSSASPSKLIENQKILGHQDLLAKYDETIKKMNDSLESIKCHIEDIDSIVKKPTVLSGSDILSSGISIESLSDDDIDVKINKSDDDGQYNHMSCQPNV